MNILTNQVEFDEYKDILVYFKHKGPRVSAIIRSANTFDHIV